MTKLYENLQTIREKRKIKSIRQLETSAGVPLGTIKRWKEKPSAAIDALEKLSFYLNCPVDSLLKIDFQSEPINHILFELGKYTIEDKEAVLIADMIRTIMNNRAGEE